MSRYVHLPLFLLLCATLAGCEPAADATAPRTLAVSGQAEISVEPEIAVVTLAVQARADRLEKARADAAEVTDRVLELTRSLDIPKESVRSTNIVVTPEFDWVEGRQELRGYLVQREVRVDLADLAKLGPLVERAVQAGVNQVSPPELKVRESRELHRRVLKLAAEDAEANARALADTLDVSLGKVRSLRALESGGVPPVPMQEMAFRARAADSGGEQTYQAGRITVMARVEAEFDVR